MGVWEDFVRVEYSLRIKHLLQLLHQSDGGVRFGVMNKVSLLEAEPVLRGDAAPVFAGPLVEEGLDPVHHLLAVLEWE